MIKETGFLELSSLMAGTMSEIFILPSPYPWSGTEQVLNMRLLYLTTKRRDRASLIAQLVKNPPAVKETPVQILGREDPLEKE